MDLTKSKLKQLIREELEDLQEQKDPKKLEAAGEAMALFVNVNQRISEVQGGGRPPATTVDGIDIFDWMARTSGYSKEEIAKVARTKKVIIQ